MLHAYAIAEAGQPPVGLRCVQFGQLLMAYDAAEPELLAPGGLEGQHPSWLATALNSHHERIEALRASLSVLPLQFGTVLRDESVALRSLEQSQTEIAAYFALTRNLQEWGLRVVASSPAVALPQSSASGADYLRARRDRAALQAQHEQSMGQLAFDAVAPLRSLARAEVERPLPSGRAGGPDALLHLALLLPLEQDLSHHSSLALCATALAAEGLALVITGPFAPYSFRPRISPA